MVRVFSNGSATELYVRSVRDLLAYGKEVRPRGKLVKELRPVTFCFEVPQHKVTFVKGRLINPFFQLAEALWIISGRSDVKFLELFNKNMKQFSDDGVNFNAPYGERIRFFGKNNAHGQIINPIDQLEDAFLTLQDDKDSRQAVIVIRDPAYDNYSYLKEEKGKDVACNLVITAKIRDEKLDFHVFNRSNDVHWGLFGANLCQFATLQELLASWLGVEVGTYYHTTDSLHTYMDDYGASNTKCFTKLLETKASEVDWCVHSPELYFRNEPQIKTTREQTDWFLRFFWGCFAGYLFDEKVVNGEAAEVFHTFVVSSCKQGLRDSEGKTLDADFSYWILTVDAMLAYALIRQKREKEALDFIIKRVPSSNWKMSMLYFLYHKYTNIAVLNPEAVTEAVETIKKAVEELKQDLFIPETQHSGDEELDERRLNMAKAFIDRFFDFPNKN